MADNSFLVVGIGASAGGVEALQAFFRPTPPDPGMAFIVVTHLGEGHESAMGQIIARNTALPVAAIENNQAVRPNHVYVLGSDAVPTLRRGRLHLRAQATGRRERNTIDVLFASLAEDAGERAVGVVLSGSGHDGTLGIKAIKEKGGLTIAQQSNETAPRYPDMPAHAIASGAVDLQVPVEQMAVKLVEYSRNRGAIVDVPATRENHAQRNRIAEARKQVCDILLNEIGHDFSGYKERTFLRRIERRMQVLEIREIERYVERLRQDHQEVVALFHDLLIGVTAFFRDKEAFEALAREVIPVLFENKGAADSVRVWVPGCATGEEVYSVAILLAEHMTTLRARPKVVCFATDIDEPAIAVARAARYPAAMLENVSPERLSRFFRGDGISYTVAKDVREMCIFSPHSVIRDPPFSRIDLISCRNLLIYLDRNLQRQLIPVFHYALVTGGYLFLGTSESLNQHGELFTPVDAKNRIYRRRALDVPHVELPRIIASGARRPVTLSEVRQVPQLRPTLPLRPTVESRIVDQFAPAHVVVTGEGDVVHFSTHTGKYLELAPGAPTRQLLAMARRGLRLDLRAALSEAAEKRTAVLRSGVRIEIGDRIQLIDLVVEPLGDDDHEPLYLVVFQDLGEPLTAEQMLPVVAERHEVPNEELERELRDTRERLQSTIEEYETAIEELKSANEELVSINEEMQSTNEELETSREEAQSINEELNTVNSELQRKVEELDEANDRLRNLFESTEIATVFLDRNLVIRHFTPAIRGIFNLMEIDRGRPLTDIVNELQGLDLQREAEPVLANGRPQELRVARRDGRAHYLMRILPYRTAERTIDGLVLTFTDITRITEIEQYQEELNRRIETMLGTVLRIAEHSIADGSASERLRDRLQALADNYRLVALGRWGNVELSELARRELGNFGIGRDGRVAVEGPSLRMKAEAAVAIGMAFHELAANAARHGALSVPEGRVHLAWEIEQPRSPEGRLVIRWRETGGPTPVIPEADGYTVTLLKADLPERIGATGAIEYPPSGVVAELRVPLASGLVILPPAEELAAP